MTETTAQPAPADTRQLPHRLTAAELADSLLAVQTINEDHRNLCTEAAHRILVMHGANDGLVKEADRLRYHLRIANNRVDEMRNGMVAVNLQLEDLRRQVHRLSPHPQIPLPNDYRLAKLRPDLLMHIKEAMCEASSCWTDVASAGTFQGERLTMLTSNLAILVSNELELARLRRTTDDNIDWRRRALEAELRADQMNLGILAAKADHVQDDIDAHSEQLQAPPARGFFGKVNAWLARYF